MSARNLLLVSSAVLIMACGAGRPAALAEEKATLGGDTAARVGDTLISAALVARVAGAQGLTARAALSLLIEDALAAKGAVGGGLDRSPSVKQELVAAQARLVVSRIRDEAHSLGPPTDAEVAGLTARHWPEVDSPEQIRVIHAVVLRPKKPDAELEKRARALAADLAQREAHATSESDFEARAKAIDHEGLGLQVERLKPFVADGRIAEAGDDGTYDGAFCSAAVALHQPGETSPVVETDFGWHVLRLIERLPERRMSIDERRVVFAEEVFATRGHEALSALEGDLRRAVPIVFTNGVEGLMAGAAAAVVQADTVASHTAPSVE